MSYSIIASEKIDQVYELLAELEQDHNIQSQDPQFMIKPIVCTLDKPCDDCLDVAADNEDLDPCVAFCYNHETQNRECGPCVRYSGINGNTVTPEEACVLAKVAIKLAIIKNHGRDYFNSLKGV